MAGTTSEFVLGGGSNSDLSRLDPAQPLVGELPWPLAEDTFVDVYAYSTPVYLGTFRVVDGKVQLSASIKSLEGGTHRLVFIGQTSRSVRVMQLTVLALANTGVALSTPFVVGALAIMLGPGPLSDEPHDASPARSRRVIRSTSRSPGCSRSGASRRPEHPGEPGRMEA